MVALRRERTQAAVARPRKRLAPVAQPAQSKPTFKTQAAWRTLGHWSALHSQLPTLSAQQVADRDAKLARADLWGALQTEIGAYPNYADLAPSDKAALLAAAQAGLPTARQQLILFNLRLVVTEAARYARRHPGVAANDPLDLFMAGVAGLEHGIRNFDPARGHQLSTYVTWWIRQAMGREREEIGNLIRIPSWQQIQRMKLARLTRTFEQREGREPSLAELAALAGLPVAKVMVASAPHLGGALSLDILPRGAHSQQAHTTRAAGASGAGADGQHGVAGYDWGLPDDAAEEALLAIERADVVARVQALIAKATRDLDPTTRRVLASYTFADPRTRPSWRTLARRLHRSAPALQKLEAQALTRVRAQLARAGVTAADLRS